MRYKTLQDIANEYAAVLNLPAQASFSDFEIGLRALLRSKQDALSAGIEDIEVELRTLGEIADIENALDSVLQLWRPDGVQTPAAAKAPETPTQSEPISQAQLQPGDRPGEEFISLQNFIKEFGPGKIPARLIKTITSQAQKKETPPVAPPPAPKAERIPVSPSPAPARPKKKSLAWAYAVVAVTLVVVGVVLVSKWRSSRPSDLSQKPAAPPVVNPAPPVAKPSPTWSVVDVRTVPPGAIISIDAAQQKQRTPAIVPTVPPGDRMVVVALEGYRPATNLIHAKIGQTNLLDFGKLEPLPAALDVKTSPSGAAIWIDSVKQESLTPATAMPVTSGHHTVVAALYGYKMATNEINLKPNDTYQIDFGNLRPLPSALDVRTTPPGAAISVDGKPQEQNTPAIILSDRAGEHAVVVTLYGYKPATSKIHLNPGETNLLDFGKLQSLPAFISVTTEPSGAAVSIDAARQDQRTPIAGLAVSAGDHAIVVSLEGYRSATNTVRLKPGETNLVQFPPFVRPGATITITSKPAEALVLTNGKSAGVLTPCTLNTLPGDLKIELFQEGYQFTARTVTLKDGDKQELAITLIKEKISALGQRWTNSLGMILAPIPGAENLFCIWETRVRDFQSFVNATHYVATNDVWSLTENGWKRLGYSWENSGFDQTPNHPVCSVNWTDTQAFCQWLTKAERDRGLISSDEEYRLPTDAEWSLAAGLKAENGTSPEEKNKKNQDLYPWGTVWPPPKAAGNYSGTEDKTKYSIAVGHGTILLYNDKYPRTAPVGQFNANQNGLYDMGGNVREWCEDWFNARKTDRTLRGADWTASEWKDLLISARDQSEPDKRKDHTGFRVVLSATRH